jgi:hypothetical protein
MCVFECELVLALRSASSTSLAWLTSFIAYGLREHGQLQIRERSPASEVGRFAADRAQMLNLKLRLTKVGALIESDRLIVASP